jgi:steroid 5-alpha reductase family enzyme
MNWEPAVWLALDNLWLLLGLATLLWLVSLWRSDASIVDPCWGAGFVLLAGRTYWQLPSPDARAALLLVLTSVWGIRLTWHLAVRNWGETEDRRYAQMRARHAGRFWIVSLFTVFWLQAVLMWFISAPIQLGQSTSHGELNWLDLVGTLVWALGFCFETVGDYQLAQFKKSPESSNQVLDRGLWRYTRHPNYFGDFCVWWGLYLVAAAGGAGATFFGPLLMSVFLMKVSGVTLLERDIAERRPGYREYVERTNAFFPGPPRR